MRNAILICFVCIALGLLASACNKQAPSDQTAATNSNAATAPATPAPAETAAAQSPAGEEAASSSQAAPAQGGPAAAPSPSAPAPPPEPEPIIAHLRPGTRLVVNTTRELSTKTVQSGQTFTATLDKPLTDNGWTYARRGSTVEGRVVRSDPGGRVKGVASISVELVSITTSDGQRIPITTSVVQRKAKTTRKKDAAKIGVGAGVGAAIGAIAGGGKGAAIGAAVGGGAGTAATLATRGDAAVIPAESSLAFTVRSPAAIKQRRR